MKSMQLLFDSPIKDYTLVAKCGKKIEVHKCVLYTASDFFKNLFTTKDMKVENELQTDVSYDYLLRVVKWIYGFDYDTKESRIKSCDGVIDAEIYEIADKYVITQLLNWKLYVFISDKYLVRYCNICDGKLQMNLVEERNIIEIKEAISIYVLQRDTIVTGGLVNKVYFYPSNDDILYYLQPELLNKWFISRYRKNSEEDMIIFLQKYYELHPDRYVEMKIKMVVGVKLSALKSSALAIFCKQYQIYGISDENLFTKYPPTFQYILHNMYIDTNRTTKLIDCTQVSKTAHVITRDGVSVRLDSFLHSDDHDTIFGTLRHNIRPLEYLLCKK